MANAQVIAKVSVLSGQAFARDSAGNMRRLKLGDAIREGESVVAGQGANVVLTLADGREMNVRPGETAKIDAEVAAAIKPDASDSAVSNNQPGFQKITQALQAGGSLDDLLEDTAAGAGPQGGNEGHTFVELLRIVETVDPLSYQFATDRGRPLDTIQGAPLVATAVEAVVAGKPTVSIPDTNNPGGADGDKTVAETSGPVPGTLTVSAPAGLATVSIGGQVFTLAQLADPLYLAAHPVTTGAGVLVLQSYDPVTGVISYTYDPSVQSNNGSVMDNIPVVVTDVLGNSTPDSLDITVTDSVPVAVNDTNNIDEDSLPGNVIGNVFSGVGADNIGADANPTPVTPANVTLAHGTLVLNSDGSYTYTLNNADPAVNALGVGQTLTDSYTYTLTDGDGSTTTAVLNITINGQNDPPVAVAAPASGDEDTPITVNLSGTDVDGTIAHVTVTALPPSSQGVLYLPDGVTPVTAGTPLAPAQAAALIFQPAPDFNGPVNIPFTVTDNSGATSPLANAPITVNPVNDPPVAVVTPASGDEDTPITVNLSGTDVDGTITHVTVTALPPSSQGVLYLPDGVTPVTAGTPLTPAQAAALIFQPAPDFNGPVNIPFTVTDNSGATSPLANAPITVNPVVDPAISIDDVTVNEAAGTITFTVTLDQPTTATVTVNYGTANGTATAGADYTAVSNTLTFNPGVTSQTVTVSIANDGTYEGSENFFVNLSGAVNASIADGQGQGTILDNGTGTGGTDDDRPSLTVSSPTVAENAGFAQFTLSLSNPSAVATTVSLGLTNGSATQPGDYTTALEVSTDGGTTWAPATSATFAPGATSVLVRTPVVNDSLAEVTENFTLTATTTAGVTSNPSAQGVASIIDNDTPSFTINDVTVNEGAGTITFTVSLSNPSATATTVDYASVAGSATTPADYAAGSSALNGTLNFAAGVTSQTITLAIANDTVYEGAESFNVNLSNATGGALIGDAQGIGTIMDDGTGTGGSNDDRPRVTGITSPTVGEGGNLDFTVTLSNTSTTPTVVTLTPASGSATLGTDTTTPVEVSFDGGTNWVTVAGPTVSVPAGTGSFIVRVPTVNDSLGEASETITLSASTAQNGSPVQGTGTITDNDTPVINISGPVTYNEAAGQATFTVTLSNASALPVTVNYGTANGSATAGSDYAAGSGTLSFAPGVTSQTITVAITNDAVFEGAETFHVNLSTPGNATLGTASSTATIIDDGTGTGGTNDDRPSLSINDVVVNEATGMATFTVTLSSAAAVPVSVGYNMNGVSATSGLDFTAGTGTLNFAAGVTSQTITVPIANDTVYEGAETFNVNLVSPSNATIADALGLGTIMDDGTGTGGSNDDRPRVENISNPTIGEGGNLDFTVTLSNTSTTPTTVTLTPASGSATLGTDTTTPVEVSFDGGTNWVTVAGPTVSVPAGTGSFIVRVPTVNDNISEPSETITLSASTAQNVAPVTGTGTITDNDGTPTLTLSGPVLVNEAAGTLTYTVTLSNPSASTVTVNYGTTNGSATAGSDYTAASGTLTFAPGVTTQTVTVNITNDSVFEGNEAYSLNLSTPSNATIAVGSVTTTIADDGTGTGGTNDDRPRVENISNPTVGEGGNLDFTVTLSNTSTTPTTVTLTPASGSATLGTDTTNPVEVSFDGGTNWVTVAGPTVSVPAGTGSFIVRVPTVNDNISEPSETITLSASTAQNVAPVTGTGTITDNDGTPTLTINDVSVNEAAGTATFTVTLSNPSSSAVSVNYGTANGTATAGADYTAVSNTLTFNPGVTSQTVTVSIANDGTYEGSENFFVNLSGAVNASIADGQGQGTILDNGTGTGGTDDDRPSLTVSSPTVAENAGFAQFTLSLSNPSAVATTVSLGLTNGSATQPGDYTTALEVSTDGGTTWAPATSATFAPGATSVLVRTPVVNDSLAEVTENFTLTATTTAGVTSNPSAQGVASIIDNDTPSFTINDVTVNEGAGTITFTVSLSNPSATATTVDYASVAGSATTPADYAAGSSALNGTLNFAAGVTSQTITLAIANDTVYEGAESFNVNLSNATGGALIGDAQGIGTIMDDGTGTGGSNDDRPRVTGITSPTVGEGGNLDFTVTLSNTSTTPTVVTLTPASGSATLGTDTTTPVEVSFDGGTNWVTVAGPTVSVPAGTGSFIVRVPTVNDSLGEASETITLSASTAQNGSPVQGTGTITDNDTPVINISGPVTYNEAAGQATFTVTLSNASALPVTVNYGTANGSATAGSDYAAGSGTLSFAPGVTSQTITVAITNDAVFEGAETFHVNLSTPGNATLGTASSTATIIDDGTGTGGTNDDRPSLSINDVVVNEATGMATFTVTLSSAAAVPVSVGYNMNGVSATSGLDFTAGTGTLNFAAGVTSQTITVPIANDTVYEGAETFNVNLVSPSNATIADALGLGTIMDDGTGTGGSNDDRPRVENISNPTIGEGGNLDFTVTLSNTSTTPTTVTLTPASGSATLGTDTTTPVEVSFDGGTNWVTVAGPTVSVPAGTGSFIVRVPTVNDNISEPSETITLSASTAQNVAPVTGTGTITDNDGTPTLTLSGPVLVNEAAGTLTYTVTLSNPSASTVTVNYGTTNGSATAGSDYTAASGTLTFAPGVTTQTVTVNITNDSVFEGNEAYSLNLSTPSNATIAVGSVTTTIADDGTGTGGTNDDRPRVENISNPTVGEGGNLDFTVTLSNTSTTPTTVTLTPASGSATLGTDTTNPVEVSFDGGTNWVTVAGPTVSVPAGTGSFIVRVPTVNDNISEPSETITLSASTAQNVAPVTGTGTITDNDGTPTLTINDVSVNEAAGTATFTVTLSNPSSSAVSVNYGTANGTATAGADYTAVSNTLTFNPGVTSQTVTVSIANDGTYEGSENFFVNLSGAVNASIADGQGQGTILDNGTGTGGTDDDRPSLTVSSPTVAENAGFAQFTLSLSNPSAVATTVSLGLTNGSATQPGDYTTALEVSTDGGTTWAPATSATFAPGATSVLVRTPVVNDSLAEVTENFTLTATTTAGVTSNPSAQGVASIIDNDTPSFTINDVTVNEGAGTITFTVSLSNPSATATTVDYASVAGSATTPADYAAGSSALNGTLNFAAGVTSQTITLAIANDTVYEGAESFNVNLSNATGGALIGDAQGIGTIMDDGTGTGGSNDDRPRVTGITSPTVGEGGNLDFTVTLSNTSTTPTVVTLTPASGSATLGTDTTTPVEVSFDGGTNWVTVAGPTVSVPAGTGSFIVRVPTVNDSLGEASETITLSASTAQNGSPVQGTGTITDNDTPVINISGPVTYNEAAGQATFTVTLSNASALPVTVNYGTANGSATAGSDYAAGSGTLSFAPGVTSQTITVAITNDAVFEGAETFHVNLSTPGNATLGTASSTATIIDDGTGTGGTNDDRPSLSINDVVVNEATGMATFTVTLSSAAAVPVSVGYNMNGVSATSGLDFTAGTGTLNFAAGVTSQTITVPIANDTVYEGAETFNVNLVSPSNATIADALGLGTIMDDGTGTGGSNDDRPRVENISNPTIGEGGNLDFTVTLSNTSTTPTTVTLTPASGSATLGTDTTTPVEVSFDGGTNWVTVAGPTVSVPAGTGSFIVRVPTVNDNISEPSETITLSASTAQNVAPVTGTGTITDNDGTPTLTLSGPVLVNEAAGTLTYTVTLSNPSASTVTVNYGTTNGSATAGSDYTAASGTLTFAPGVTTQTVTVNITNDSVFEGNEAYSLNLSTPSNATIAVGSVTTTIADDGTGTGGTNDDRPRVENISNPTVGEGGNLDFTVTLSNTSTTPTTVTLTPASGSATLGTDTTNPVEVSFDGGTNWVTVAGPTVSVPAGTGSFIVRVPTVNDNISEPSETITLSASTAQNVAPVTGTGTITDNDGTPTLTINDVSVNEAAGTATFTVTLSNPSSSAVSVNYGTANGTATAGADYTAVSNTLTFNPGVTSQTVTVSIANDGTYEGSENFFVNLSGAVNASIADGQGQGTILDNGTGTGGTDDDRPSLTVSSPTVAENAGFAQFTLSLSNPSAVATTVSLGLTNGSATQPGDYTTALEVSTDGGTTWAPATSATFAPGATSVLVRTPVVNDSLAEVTENFTLTATTTAGVTSNPSAQGVASIIDNDTPSFTINDVTVNEGAGTITFTVSLSNPSATATTVDYASVAGSATTPADYAAGSSALNGTLNFAAGVTSQTITLAIANDTVYEGAESFNVNLSNATGGALIGDAQGIGTIMDDGTGTGGSNDDRPRVTGITSPTVGEGGNLDFTVTLSNTSTTPTVVTLTPASGSATLGTDTTTPVEVSFDGGTNWVTVAGPTVSVPAGTGSFIVRVPTVNDSLGEASETITLSASTAQNGSPVQGTGTITDNDTPVINISGPVTYNEAAGQATFTVTLSNASALPVTVNYGTANGSATAGSDYAAGSGTLSFAPGVTSQTITVAITNDAVFEGAETFHVNLSTPGNATLGTASSTATIIDDGTGTGGTNDDRPSLSINDVVVNEATGMATFTVTLSSAAAVPVSVGYNMNGVSATSGLDFTAGTGTLNFAAGVTSQTITVPIANDTVYEGAETFNVNLVSPSNATIADALGLGTIMDDGTGTGGTNSDIPTLSVNSVSMLENTDFAVFTVSLSNASVLATTVSLATTNGTATSPSDYTTAIQVSTNGGVTWTPASSATIAAGTTSVLVRVPVVNDGLDETNETFVLTATRTAGVTANPSASGTGTIIDNDSTPVAQPDTNTTTEDAAVSAGVLGNDSDADGNALAVVGVLAGSSGTPSGNVGASVAGTYGSVVINADGSYTYTPGAAMQALATGQSVQDVFTYRVSDGNGNFAQTTLTITINGQNDTPLGQNLNVTTAEDVPYVFSLASFPMSDAEQGSPSNPSSIRIDSLPANGILSLNGVPVTVGQLVSAADLTAGNLVFTPAADANGSNYANFNFSVRDASGLFDTIPNTVTVNVTAVSDGTPLAGNDNFLTTLGTPITITPSQLLVNDYLPDHARITGISGVSSGTLVANGDGSYTYTPAATGNATFTYTVTDDDGQTGTATVTLQTVAARDDLATVSESALPDGTGGGTTIATGNVLSNDGGGASINQVVYNGTNYTASGGYITINTTSGKLVLDATGTGVGDYTYTLLRNADNSAAGNDNNVVESFQYTSNTGVTANLRVTINDDEPAAFNRTVQVSEDAVPSYRLVLVLDVSGSMDTATAGGEVRNVADDGTVTISTRLAMAKEAMASLVSEYFNQAQNVSITFVTFSGSAAIVNATPITDKATALSTIATLDGSGGTNYESALNAVQSAFGTINTSVQNTVYFISDGAPSVGNTTDPVGASNYDDWLAANPAVDSYAVGVGTGIATTSALNAIHNVDADGDGVKDGAIIVPDLNDLAGALLSTVPVAYGGNIISNSNLGNVLGADGGYVQTLTMMLDSNADGTPDTNVVFTYNSATNQISRSGAFPSGFPISGDLLTLDAGEGFTLGTLTFNFTTGAYTYFTSGSATEGDSFALTFVARDGDGDVTQPTTLTVEIADGKPIARSDIDTLLARQTHMEGNVISGLGTDGGQALGGTLTSFAASGSGVDTAVDGSQVSSVTFKGMVYDLTTNGSGSGTGYTWSVSAGKLTWTATAGGESLVFANTGFYDYTPPTAAVPNPASGATQTTLFNTAANADDNGVVLSGYSRTGVAQTLNYTDASGTADDGVGISGGGSNTRVDNLETLVVTFAQGSHPNGVQNVSFVVATNASNLGNDGAGTITSLTYSVYDMSGALLGRFYSFAEGSVTIPSEYSNIGRIEIEGNSAASARISSVSFADVVTNTTASGVAPTEIGYTLTDTDGDSSSATLTLRVMANNLFGDGTNNSIVGTNANDRIDGGAGNDMISGGLGHDLVIGGAGNDILDGNDGNDDVRGGTGNDTVYGGAGNDILSGGFGTDILTGGSGSDVFRWELADRGASGSVPIDTVVDFVDAGDKLDLRDLLQGETQLGGVTGNLTNYLHFTTSGSDTVIQVSSAGGFSSGFNAGAVDQTILVENVDLTVGGTLTSDQQIIQQLLANNKLITD